MLFMFNLHRHTIIFVCVCASVWEGAYVSVCAKNSIYSIYIIYIYIYIAKCKEIDFMIVNNRTFLLEVKFASIK